MKKIILVLLLLFGLCACQSEMQKEINACGVGDENCTEENEGAAANLIWDKLTLKESLDHLTDEKVILFFSFDDCPYCKEARPILEEVGKDEAVKIYYVDVKREERNEDNADYQQLYAYLEKELTEQNYDKVYMPSVAFIENGELIGLHVGTVDGHEPSKAEMTDEQKSELRSIYQNYYDGLK